MEDAMPDHRMSMFESLERRVLLSAAAVIEAELYDGIQAASGSPHQWQLVTDASASNARAMQITPDIGGNNNGNTITQGPRLDYRLQLERGTYYIWVRGKAVSNAVSSSDSVHVGMNGKVIPTSTNIDGFTSSYSWRNMRTADGGARATIQVLIPTVHTLNVWMREDGFMVDKILLTTDPNYIPSGTGPDEIGRFPRPIDPDGPRIQSVRVGSTQWSDAFRQAMGGGYPIGSGPDQATSLPWSDLDQIAITFDKPVNIHAGHLMIRGTSDTNHYASGFHYDQATRTATWILAKTLVNERVVLDLSQAVTSAEGVQLDGEWINQVSAVSGDGTPGGNFRFEFSVLVGDVTGDGAMTASDVLELRANMGRVLGQENYHPRYDLDGSGSMTASDVLLARSRMGNVLPNASPTPVNQPNIVFILADDWGDGHASILGMNSVSTPNFDRVAQQGVLFKNAFVASPSCSPARNSILTGMPLHQLGNETYGHYQRSAPIHLWGWVRQADPVYQDYLKQAGYNIGLFNKGIGPVNASMTDWLNGQNPAGPSYSSFGQFLNTVGTNEPFSFWFGSENPHRNSGGFITNNRPDPAVVEVPPWLPDVQESRGDLAGYYGEVKDFDNQIGVVLRELESRGLADNTIIVITSDNGMPFARAKRNVYDSGARVPLAIRWPDAIAPGQVVEDVISVTDVAATLLEAARLPVPMHMTTQSSQSLLPLLLHGQTLPRQVAFIEREQHERHFPPHQVAAMRAIRTQDFLYIRNFNPEGILGDDGGATYNFLVANQNHPVYGSYYQLAFANRPPEELYDVRHDPYQFNNLANDPAYADVLADLRLQLADWMSSTGDFRSLDVGSLTVSAPSVSPPATNPMVAYSVTVQPSVFANSSPDLFQSLILELPQEPVGTIVLPTTKTSFRAQSMPSVKTPKMPAKLPFRGSAYPLREVEARLN